MDAGWSAFVLLACPRPAPTGAQPTCRANGTTHCALPRLLLQVWAYQGNRTLAYYLKRRDCLQALATDLGVPEEVVVPRVMRDIFTCLAVSGRRGAGLAEQG